MEASLKTLKTVFDIQPVCYEGSTVGEAAAPVPSAADRRLLSVTAAQASGRDIGWAIPQRGGGLRQLQLKRWKRKTPRVGEMDLRMPKHLEALQERTPEFSAQREQMHVSRGAEIQRAMSANLRAAGWLGGFEPMAMNCPLLGRRVAAEAVSDFAEHVWRCDGFGFNSSCLLVFRD